MFKPLDPEVPQASMFRLRDQEVPQVSMFRPQDPECLRHPCLGPQIWKFLRRTSMFKPLDPEVPHLFEQRRRPEEEEESGGGGSGEGGGRDSPGCRLGRRGRPRVCALGAPRFSRREGSQLREILHECMSQ
ncbi:Hypothetical predicted protein [Marmota monax]|uniref:Uncharacterized protein n=1 Tax=Marmota monax TaxID=9995 RepID=A0A5E4B011_MARMO|nr:Hypothetical predicted protein [Marmota monax]